MQLLLHLSQVTLSLSSLISLGYHKYYLLMFNDPFLIHLHPASHLGAVKKKVEQVVSMTYQRGRMIAPVTTEVLWSLSKAINTCLHTQGGEITSELHSVPIQNYKPEGAIPSDTTELDHVTASMSSLCLPGYHTRCPQVLSLLVTKTTDVNFSLISRFNPT